MILRSALALAVTAPAALAGTCGPDGDADVALFEEAKAAILAADYRTFADLAGPYFSDLRDNFDSYFGQIQVAFPHPFERCATVLQRREEPGFLQELIFYFPKGSEAPLALILIAADVGGEVNLIEFNMNTSLSEVLGDLK